MCAKQVHLIDASFVWTEPHSKRIKVKLIVQKEVIFSIVILYYSLLCGHTFVKFLELWMMQPVTHMGQGILIVLRLKTAGELKIALARTSRQVMHEHDRLQH